MSIGKRTIPPLSYNHLSVNTVQCSHSVFQIRHSCQGEQSWTQNPSFNWKCSLMKKMYQDVLSAAHRDNVVNLWQILLSVACVFQNLSLMTDKKVWLFLVSWLCLPWTQSSERKISCTTTACSLSEPRNSTSLWLLSLWNLSEAL